jgi:hypothetical protein
MPAGTVVVMSEGVIELRLKCHAEHLAGAPRNCAESGNS